MNITLDRLKYFVEVATFEHVGNAARNLAISPSVISSAITTLEDELGCELFKREHNRIRLNSQGHKLLELAKKMLSDAQNIYSEMSSKDSILRGHYKVGASPALAPEFLIGPWLQAFKNNPLITAEFVSQDTGALISQVLSGQLDMAVVYSPLEHENIEEKIIQEGKFLITLKKNHPIFEMKSMNRIAHLNELPTITFKASTGPNVCENHPVFAKFGIRPNHRYYYDNDRLAIELVTKTGGWAFMPDHVIEEHSSKLEVLTLKNWDAPMRISLVTNRKKTFSPVLEEFSKISVSNRR